MKIQSRMFLILVFFPLSLLAETSSRRFVIQKGNNYVLSISECKYKLEEVEVSTLGFDCGLSHLNNGLDLPRYEGGPFSCNYPAVCTVSTIVTDPKNGHKTDYQQPGSKVYVNCIPDSQEIPTNSKSVGRDQVKACMNKTFDKCAEEMFTVSDRDYEKQKIKEKVMNRVSGEESK